MYMYMYKYNYMYIYIHIYTCKFMYTYIHRSIISSFMQMEWRCSGVVSLITSNPGPKLRALYYALL